LPKHYITHLIQDKCNNMNHRVSHKSDLFKEVGDGQRCWTESGEVTHLIPHTHPLKALLLPLIPSSVTFSLWREDNSQSYISIRHVLHCYFLFALCTCMCDPVYA